MKSHTLIGALLLALLLSSVAVATEANVARAQTQQGALQLSKVMIRVGNDADQDSTLQAKRLLENEGLVYEVVADANASGRSEYNYSLIMILGSTDPLLDADLALIRNNGESGAGLIWVGKGLPQSLYDLAGLVHETETQIDTDTALIRYENSSTHLYAETIQVIDSHNASTIGVLVDSEGKTLGPAELSFKKGPAGRMHYFAYDALAWWFADEETPWLRAYRVHLAVEEALSQQLTVRLLPYPRGMQSAFITRIEDVDPLHTNLEWLYRGENLLNYYSNRDGALTVSLTPTYVDPSLNLNFGIEELSAHWLKEWLSKVLLRGGTIVEHGYTHQIGDEKTGVAPEFFDETTQTWLSMENQKLRIATAAKQIRETLGFNPRGFEAPHYVANADTYEALSALGFQYVTQNSNTPFSDRFNLGPGLVNVPETLGYIPNNSSDDVEARIESNMNYLYEMGGVMLYFNHLFDDQMLQTGRNLLDYVAAKGDVWLTNAQSLADFWNQRYNAYGSMTTAIADDALTVELGSSSRAGLTLEISNSAQIEYVLVNGAKWSVFDNGQVILPVLPETSNTIVLGFDQSAPNSNQIFGYPLIAASLLISVLFMLKKTRFKQLFNWRRM